MPPAGSFLPLQRLDTSLTDSIRVLHVEDDGPGIPPEDREESFEIGYAGAAGGTGFGLSIVEQVADAHGWTVESTEGAAGGARFGSTDVEFVEDE